MIRHGAYSFSETLFIKKLNSNKWNGTGKDMIKYFKKRWLNVHVWEHIGAVTFWIIFYFPSLFHCLWCLQAIIHKVFQITFWADGIGKVEQWSLSHCPCLVLLNVHVLWHIALFPVAPVFLCQMLLLFKLKLVLNNHLQEIPQKYFWNSLHPECNFT